MSARSRNVETTEKKAPRFIAQGALRKNMQINQHATNLIFLFGGAMSGILGLSGWSGFLLFFICAAFLIGLLQMKSGFDWIKYFPDYSNLTNGYPTALKSYVLMWTFFYGLIHIY